MGYSTCLSLLFGYCDNADSITFLQLVSYPNSSAKFRQISAIFYGIQELTRD